MKRSFLYFQKDDLVQGYLFGALAGSTIPSNQAFRTLPGGFTVKKPAEADHRICAEFCCWREQQVINLVLYMCFCGWTE